MCTAISVTVNNHYFGRNLDFEHGFGEKIVITPRHYRFNYTNGTSTGEHFAIIGMALPFEGYPLYFDAANERGLCMAGLNFPRDAVYSVSVPGRENVASFELIPYILTRCATVADAEQLLSGINITGEAFREDMPPTPLHFIIADAHRALTLEQTEYGVRVYENAAGVLTNSPSFDMQMLNLSNYMSVSRGEPVNNFSDRIDLCPYSRGMGGVGLPGDLSSMSRFVRASFVKLNSVYGRTEGEVLSQFFHILYSVYQVNGCATVGDAFEITRYTSCINASRGVYYYTTYNNSRISAVDMHRENLDGEGLITYELIQNADIMEQN